MLKNWNVFTKWSKDASMADNFPAVLPPWCLGIPSTQPTTCRAPGQVETRGFLTTGPSPGAVGSASLAWCPEGPQQPRYLLKTLGKPIRKLKQTAVSHGPRCLLRRDVPETQLWVSGRVACPQPEPTVPMAAGAEPGFLPEGKCLHPYNVSVAYHSS